MKYNFLVSQIDMLKFMFYKLYKVNGKMPIFLPDGLFDF